MSSRGNLIRARQKLKGKFDERQPLMERWFGLMGDGTGTLYPDPTDPVYVFVRRTGRGRVERIRNTRVPARNNLPVIVGFSPERPDEPQVLDMDDVALTTLGAYGYIMGHHQQHELHNVSGGDDTVWVFTQQFLYLLCQVTDPISDSLEVRDGLYLWNGAYRLFPGAVTVDLTVYDPGAGLAVMVLVYVDAKTGNLGYAVGTPFAIALPSSMWYGQVPATPDASIPVAAVYVPNGVTTFDWDYVLDWRVFINVAGNVQPHNILSTSHTDTAPGTLVAGDLLVASVAATPVLQRLPKGTAHQLLKMNAGATIPEWHSFDWDEVSVAAGADMVHNHSTNAEGGEVPLASIGSYAQGRVIYGGVGDWTVLAHPGAANRVLQSSAAEVAWSANAVTFPAAGPVPVGTGGVNQIAYWIDANTLSGNALFVFDGNDMGLGTAAPNISGEARAFTIEDDTSAPVIELSLRDDIFAADTVVGIVRWFSGNVDQCAVAQIDVLQSGWYETGSTMRFWAADDCALCLAMELNCDGARVNDKFALVSEDATELSIWQYSSDTVSPRFEGRKARGTEAAPSAVNSGDSMFNLVGMGYDGAAFEIGARFQMRSNENWGVGNHGSNIRIRVVPDGTTTQRTAIYIDDDCGVTIGYDVGAHIASAALEIASTTGALVVPRMTTAQRGALTAANGMIVYDTTVGAFYFYEAGAWVTGSGLV